jgi:hypothetical protein
LAFVFPSFWNDAPSATKRVTSAYVNNIAVQLNNYASSASTIAVAPSHGFPTAVCCIQDQMPALHARVVHACDQVPVASHWQMEASLHVRYSLGLRVVKKPNMCTHDRLTVVYKRSLDPWRSPMRVWEWNARRNKNHDRRKECVPSHLSSC